MYDDFFFPYEKAKLWTGNMVLLSLSNFLLYASLYMMLPALPLWMVRHWYCSYAEAGAAVAVFGLAMFLPGAFNSYLIDTFKRKSVCLVAMLLFVASSLLYPYVATVGFIALVRAVQGGLFSVITMTTGSTLVIDVTASRRRTDAKIYTLSLDDALPIYWNFHHVVYTCVALGTLALLLILAVDVPFRAPLRTSWFSLDRFLLPRTLWPALNMMMLSAVFGILIAHIYNELFYICILIGFIISLLGGSKVQIGGPTGAFIVIIYGIIQQYGEAGLIVATLMAGVILILLGVFKLGAVIKFIPYPIIVGFTSGIAVTIFTTQIADVFGLNFGGEKVPGDFIGKWLVYFRHFDTVNWWNTVVSIASIVIIAITPKFSKKIPGSLIAIIVVTVAVYLMKMYGGIDCIDTIGDRFSIKAELPDAVMPALDWEAIKNLFPVAITIAVLGAIESLLSATVADGVIGDKHDSNTELIAQGVANMATPLFGGIPATGAIARTMANINNGGKSPVAGIVHAVVLLLILLLLMPLAQYIPMGCLAGVLVVVSYNMSGWRVFKALLKNPKSDVTVLLITFFLTVIFDLTVAIEVGLVIACVLFMRRVMETTEISVIKDEIDPNAETDITTNEEHLIIPKGVEVYEINGPYFFGIATKFEEVMAQLGDRPKVRIIRMRKVPFIDSTGIHNLESLCKMSQKEKITVVLSGVNTKVHQVLEKADFYTLLGKENICPNINVALERAHKLVE